jgi:copper chaperone CopZ
MNVFEEGLNLKKVWITIGLTAAALTAIIWGEQLMETSANEGRVNYTIENVQCDNCANELSVAIENILGIEAYTYNAENNTLTIDYNPTVMETEWITESLMANGYRIEEQ